MTPHAVIFFTVFFFALGACIGSFLNVLIWRLPHRGQLVTCLGKTAKLTLSWPPSHCPHCDAPIPWYQNIPVLAWHFLRGRCAKCRNPIAIRYPLVELATALLFAALFLAYFVAGYPDPAAVPHAFIDIRTDWSPFLLHLTLVAALLAASAIDADWFIIPLSIPAFLTIVALLAAPFTDFTRHLSYAILPHLDLDPKAVFSLANLGLPTIAAAVGLLLANLLLHVHLLPLSFPPPKEETPAEKSSGKSAQKPGAAAPMANGKSKMENSPSPVAPPPNFTHQIPIILAVTIILALVATAWLLHPLLPLPASPPHALAALVSVIAAILIFLLGVLPRDPAPPGATSVAQEVMEEISAPHARREILKELLFLAFPVLFGLVALAFPVQLPASPWLARVLGTVFGFLVGGGVVWLIRIGGTLLFGREAMGLGDVHLMAAVGAIIGPALATLTVFVFAPILGLAFAVVLMAMRKPNVLPFGPWLSIGAILSLLIGNSAIHWYAAHLAH